MSDIETRINPSTGNLDLIGLGVSYVGTETQILATAPSRGLAYATDLGQLMFYSGSAWYVLSAYLDIDLSAPDMGWLQNSNRSGYGKSYVTDKVISNSSFGANANTTAGGIRYNTTLLKLQAYLNSAWETIVSNLLLEEVSTILEHTPIGYTSRIKVFSGNSDNLGLNGLPIVQGYKVSMGCYPVPAQIDGGSF